MAEPGPGPYLESAVVTEDTLVFTGAADVYWIAVSNDSTAAKWELNDSTDDSGTDKFAGYEAAGTSAHMLPFPTPIHFATGIWADIQAGGIILTIEYAIL